MGGGNSRRINGNIGPAASLGPGPRPRAIGPGVRPPIAAPRYIPFPAPAPFPVCPPPPCGPRVVSFPPQVRFLPPLPPRIIQLPPKILPVPTPVRCCLPPPPVQCCLPPPPCQPCLPAPPPLRCLPAPCPPCPPCQPCPPPCLPYGPCGPYLPQVPCLPGVQGVPGIPCAQGIPQHQIIQRPYAATQQYVVPQQPGGYLQPAQQYIPQHVVPQQGPYLTAPRSVAGRPVDNALLPSRQIEYVPTPVKQIDYAPPQTLSNRQIAYSGKISRRSDYDDFDDVAGVRPEGTVVDGSARSGKFAFYTPGLDDTRVNSGSPGSNLEYFGENASRAQSGIEYQPQAGAEVVPATASGVQYRAVNQAPEGGALTQQTAAGVTILEGSPEAAGIYAPSAATGGRYISSAADGSRYIGSVADGAQYVPASSANAGQYASSAASGAQYASSAAGSGAQYATSALSGAPGTASGVQYRRVNQAADGASIIDAPGRSSAVSQGYRLVTQQPEGPSGSISQAATAAAAASAATGSVIDGQGQYRSIQNAATPAQTQASQYRLITGQPEGAQVASVNRGSLTGASLYSAVQNAQNQAQNASTPTPSNQAPSYRIITQQPDGTTTIREGTTLPSGIQYRVVQSATPNQQYRLSNDDGSVADADLAANSSQDEYVEAVSEDGVHYRPVTSQPILTNIRLAKTLTQQSGRPLSSLQQYVLNNNSNLSNINELNNLNNAGNTYSIARSVGTLSQQQQQDFQDQQQQLQQQIQQQIQQQQQQQQQDQDQEMIEIPVNVPVKVRIPAPNAANKQQIYNTTIECRQKPYCPERDGSITSN